MLNPLDPDRWTEIADPGNDLLDGFVRLNLEDIPRFGRFLRASPIYDLAAEIGEDWDRLDTWPLFTESFEIVRRRLFASEIDYAARDAVVNAFGIHGAGHLGEVYGRGDSAMGRQADGGGGSGAAKDA